MRLTEKYDDYYISKATCTDDLKLKLGQLEDIEEYLKIDLITLCKALEGIWVKDRNNYIYYVGCPYMRYAENSKRELEMQFRVGDTWYYFKDYGKNWALTREELERK